jgi:hypothetical protein
LPFFFCSFRGDDKKKLIIIQKPQDIDGDIGAHTSGGVWEFVDMFLYGLIIVIGGWEALLRLIYVVVDCVVKIEQLKIKSIFMSLN